MRSETKTLRYMKKTPNYKLTGHDGQIVAQHHLTGHTHGIVYFLQSIQNARCREYCQELSQRAAMARVFKTAMAAIAPEPVEELARAHQEWQLQFPLLSDSGSKVAERYGLVESGWLRSRRVTPAVIVHDKYGIAYFLAVAEKPEERPAWEEIEAVLRRFPRA